MLKNIFANFILLAILSLSLEACAPGYTASDMKEGLQEDADQIGDQFKKDVKSTENIFVQIGDDLSGKNSEENQHLRQMAKLCDTSEAEIHDLRKSGLTWKQIAGICRLNANPNAETVWMVWEN